jgi:hypothetical protein
MPQSCGGHVTRGRPVALGECGGRPPPAERAIYNIDWFA